MDSNKIMLFISKMITMTKDQALTWYRLQHHKSCKGYLALLNKYDIDSYISFYCNHNTGFIFLFYIKNEDTVHLAIQPSKDSRLEFINVPENDIDTGSQIKRLYNIIFNKLPNIDNFIEDFNNDVIVVDDDDDDDLPF